MIKIKTIQGWANSSSLICSPNTNNRKFIKNLEKFKKENNLKEYHHFFQGGFYSKKLENKKRYIIKAWYWRGSWSDPTKETYCYLIEK